MNSKNGRDKAPILRLLKRSEKHRDLILLTIAASIVDRACDAVPSTLIGTAVDVAAGDRDSLPARFGLKSLKAQLTALGIGSLGLWTLDAASAYGYQVLSSQLASVIQHDLRLEVYNHLQELDLAKLEERQTTEWMNVLQDDIGRIEDFIKDALEPLMGLIVNAAIGGATFAALSPRLALMQLGIVPVVYFTAALFTEPVRSRVMESREVKRILDNLLAGNIAGIGTIFAFNAQEREASRVQDASQKHVEASRRAFLLNAAFGPAMQMAMGLGFLTTLVAGITLVREKKLSLGSYNMLGIASIRLFGTLSRLGFAMQHYQKSMLSFERILDVVDARPAIASGTRPLPADSVRGEIELDRVVFGYEDTPVLRGVQMRFQAGKTTAIVGTTGAGKSTVLKLLLRFYDAHSGVVRVDGNDIRELNLTDLRSTFALVSQQIFLFAGTIRDNIAFGRPGASMDEVVQAAQIAEAHEFIQSLPRKYDTEVGERGHRLSGGQRQRIAIARALLANRPILLFDEATSAVDNETEAAIQRSLREATRGRTMIIVAHRLSTIRHADLIYVLDDGQVREQGKHDDLVAMNGLYATFWRVQTGELSAV